MTTFSLTFPMQIVMLETTTKYHAAFHAIQLDSGMLAIPLFTDEHLMEIHIKENKIPIGYHRDINNQEALILILRALSKLSFEAVVFDPGKVGRKVPFVQAIQGLLEDLERSPTE